MGNTINPASKCQLPERARGRVRLTPDSWLVGGVHGETSFTRASYGL